MSRSLSFGAAITGTVQLEESLDDGNTYDMCQEEADLGYESKGTVRMSFKQVAGMCCNCGYYFFIRLSNQVH